MKRIWLFRCLTLLLALVVPAAALAEAGLEGALAGAGTVAEAAEQEALVGVEFDGEPLPGEEAVEMLPPEAEDTEAELSGGDVVAEDAQAAAVELESVDLLADAMSEPVTAEDAPIEEEAAGETPEAAAGTPGEGDAPVDAGEAPEAAAPADDGDALAELDPVDGGETPDVVKSAAFPASLVLGVKEKYTLKADAVLSGKILYASSKSSVVSVGRESGKLTAKKKGTAKIVAMNAGKKYVTCTVKVVAAPSKVMLSKSKLVLAKGSSARLTAKLPKGSTSALTYTSSNAAVAKVDASGNVRGVKAGTAVITVKTFNGKKASCKVTVLNGSAPKTLRLNKTSVTMGVGQKLKLKPKLNAGAEAVYTWTSGNRKVATVSSKGVLTAKKAGTVKILVKTHNGLKRTCTVKVVKAPGKVSLSPAKLTVAVGGSGKLTANLPRGTAAGLTWSSSDASVATVSGGKVSGLQAGVAKITVRTHNGKTAKATVTVVADPEAPATVTGRFDQDTATVKLGNKIVIGGSVQAENTFITSVKVTVNSKEGTLSAKVGALTAVNLQDAACGGAFVVNTTKALFSKKGTYTLRLYATESTGTASGKLLATMSVTVAGNSNARMVENLKADSYLGAKKDGIAGIVQLLLSKGYEPAFAAGVAANVMCEGDYGFFESSRYITYPKNRPRYFAYLDGGNYYANQNGTRVLTEVFLSKKGAASYTGKLTASVRYGKANYYMNTYSGKNAWNVNLTKLEKLLANLEKGNWKGKFGLGVVQWTASRTKSLVKLYRKHAGEGDTITKAQVIAAENEMILSELKNGYAHVYSGWKNGGSLSGESSACRAAEVFCRKYEIPAGIEAAVAKRRTCARQIYKIMME